MKILYIAVHRHRGWGAEHWLALAFERMGHQVLRYDYRQKRRQWIPWWLIQRDIRKFEQSFKPDIVFLQRAEKMPISIPAELTTPVVFWSTEQLARRRDVDQLLAQGDLFKWIYLHTYTCVDYVKEHFAHLNEYVSVLHNATGVETLSNNTHRPRLAIFNRNLSPRRRQWLDECGGLVEVIEGQYGEAYFNDLSQSKIALNIHFSDVSLDDFETGIYEALASGCFVISETLDGRTVRDLKMQDAVIQVASASQMREAVEFYRDHPEDMAPYLRQAERAIRENLWDARAKQLCDKFSSVIGT